MRKYMYITLLILFHFACEQRELTENDNFGYEVTISSINEGFLLESNAISLTIVPERMVNQEQYTFSYSISSGLGQLLYKNEIISINESLTLDTITPQFNYIPETLGEHEITIIIENRGGIQEEKKVQFTITEPVFRFNGSFLDDSIFKDQQTAINFNVVKSSQIDSEQTFRLKYVLNSGSATIKTSLDEVLQPNRSYDIDPGVFNWIFEATEVGEVDITFFVENDKGTEREVNLVMNVLQTEFNFSASAQVSTAAVRNPVQINYLLNNLGAENLTYTMRYSSNKTGIFEYNGVQYGPNVPIPVTIGSFSATYTTTEEGEANLFFEIEASNGLKRDADVKIAFESFDFTVTYDNSRNYIANEEVNFNISIDESIADTYTLRYLESNESRVSYNGTIFMQNQPISIDRDNFTIGYSSPSIGNKEIIFILTSSAMKEVRKTVRVNVVNTTFEVIGYTLPEIMVVNNLNSSREFETTFRVQSDFSGDIRLDLVQESQDGCEGSVSIVIRDGNGFFQDLRVNPNLVLRKNIDYTLEVIADSSICRAPAFPGIGRYVFNLEFRNQFHTNRINFSIQLFGPS